jgi:hypothetical protein
MILSEVGTINTCGRGCGREARRTGPGASAKHLDKGYTLHYKPFQGNNRLDCFNAIARAAATGSTAA